MGKRSRSRRDVIDDIRRRAWRAYADGRRRLARTGSAAPAIEVFAAADRREPSAWTDTLADQHEAYRRAIAPATGSVAAVCVSARPHLLADLLGSLRRQVVEQLDVVLVTNHEGYDAIDLDGATADLGAERVIIIRRPSAQTLGACLNDAMAATDARFVAKFDDDDHYGPHHLADSLRAHSYAGAGVVGKHTYYAHLVDADRTVLRFPAHEFAYSSTLAGGSLVIDRAKTADLQFPDISLGEDRAFLAACHRRGLSTFSADRFNFIQTRAHDNTWQVPDERFLQSTADVGPGLRLDVTDI